MTATNTKGSNNMTNREHLNTLDDMHYAIAVLAKVSELQEKNFNPEDDIFESLNNTQMDFEDWLSEYYDETPSTTAQDGQRAAAGISPTSEEKRQEGSTDAPKTANNVELFNLMNGAAFISKSERDAHPNAEYFTAQIETRHVGRVLPSWEPDEVKSVTLTFRKTDKPEEGKQSAIVTDDGMTMLCDDAEAAENVEVVGVLVRSVLSFVG